MDEEFLIRVFIGAMVPVTALVTYLLNRRHDTETETRDSTAKAITAVADASHTVVDLMSDVLNPLRAQLENHRKRIECQEGKLTVMETNFQTLVSYTKVLRQQIIELGHEPLPFPDELDHLNGEIE